MPTPGANLSYANSSQLWEVFFRKLGVKTKSLPVKANTGLRDNDADAGTTFPRQIGICAKYSATAPTTNTAADAPTGIGDICVLFKANTVGGVKTVVASIDVYRCTAYTNTTTFTWAQIL